ncbi:double-strand break repair protein AddB [Benzoatithermus flavus]|uniref:Double-strand break repair protein AddB n=1 Tax=Benzoatithermus flavus TaxID=3108223 RepID=A0ABU8XLJ3_9PROT
MANVYTIAANRPFLDCLVGELLAWDRERLADTLLLMPSRRACLAARDTFLRLSRGDPLLLPRLVPIGEPDEAEILIDPEIELDLPPAIEPLRRRLLLTRLVLARDNEMTHEQAVRLAGELESFIDELHNEEIDLESLDRLAPADLAEHWQETLRFLQILREAWPAILKAEGRIDATARRCRLVNALCEKWQRTPPSHPVLAAGLTGSIPCVARLLACVARHDQGCVVVPALDRSLDERGWRAVGPSHPQFGLKRLLAIMEVDRAAVRDWPDDGTASTSPARVELWRQVLRPASTTDDWRREVTLSPEALTGLELCEAPDHAAEALHLALRLRAAIETPGRRAILVTPSRFLGRRVAAELLRWGIRVDDSAGVPLDQSPPGSFLLLTAHLIAEQAPPVTLLAALKHPLASGGMGQRDFRRYVRALERAILRGPRLAGGLDGLMAALRERDPLKKWPAPVPPEELLAWLERLAEDARPLVELLARPQAPFLELLRAHLGFAERLAADAEGGSSELWAKEAGACARQFVAELELAAEVLDEVPTGAYPALLAVLMGTKSVRPRHHAHPRIAILGQLESRLVQADLVLVGGLNEGAWPPSVDSGPWLNRAMRAQLGLPPVEQAIGFAAHDFLMSVCAPEVVLSRAAKDENGAPTTPSRWVARLNAVLKAVDAARAVTADACWTGWTEALDAPDGPPRPIRRPEPRPPLHARPRELWATDIERLMRDPYAVYARKVLDLEPLDPLDADPGGAERGEIIHQALEEFVRTWPCTLPDDPCGSLIAIGLRHFARQGHRPQVWTVWWPRFERIAAWFCEVEKRRREQVARIVTEVRGMIELETPAGAFRVRARADRVEILSDGKLAIVDYKTGPLPRNGEVQRGLSPQLPIECLIAAAGGFSQVPACPPAAMLFWGLKGGEPVSGEERNPLGKDGDLAELLGHAKDGLARLIAHFDNPNTPYVPVPRPEIAPAFNDYEHLARLKEWWGTEAEA